MAKRTTAPALMLPPRATGTPAQPWLCAALRAEILEGRLGPGARLPAHAATSPGKYGVARGTVVTAFEQLQAEGYVEGSVGSGTYVSRDPARYSAPGGKDGRSARPRSEPRWSGRGPTRSRDVHGRRVHAVPARYARPQPRLPRQHAGARPVPNDPVGAARGAPPAPGVGRPAARLRPAGLPPVAGGGRRLPDASARGVRCAPDQVAIVSGVQEALDLTARLFLNPGDRVAMEDPGYVGAALVFEAAGARISALPLDDEGLEPPGAAACGASGSPTSRRRTSSRSGSP